MHYLLQKLLNKSKIKNKDDMTSEEKQNFTYWEKVLSGGEISVDKIKEFCGNQISLIETQWQNLDNDYKKNERLIIAHNIYKTLLKVIESPNKERETLEAYLNKLINS